MKPKEQPATRASPTVEAYFGGRPESRSLYEAARTVLLELGDVTERVTKSQVAFWRVHPFAWLWIPEKYMKRQNLAPLVLSIGLFRSDNSGQWKEVAEPKLGRFMHHLELRRAKQIDGQMKALLKEAWDTVGVGQRRS